MRILQAVFLGLLAFGCSRPSPVTPPSAAIAVPGRPVAPVTVAEFKAAVVADKALLAADKKGLDAAESARIRKWLLWVTGVSGVLAGLAFLSRFYPPLAGLQWLVGPVAHYASMVAALAFACLWLVPYRYWIGGGAVAAILGYQVLRLFFRNSNLYRVAKGLSAAVEQSKVGAYVAGATASALTAAGADLELAERIKQAANPKGTRHHAGTQSGPRRR